MTDSSYSCPNRCEEFQNIKTNNAFANCKRCGSRLRRVEGLADQRVPVAWQYRYRRWGSCNGEWSEWTTMDRNDSYRNPDYEYRPLFA